MIRFLCVCAAFPVWTGFAQTDPFLIDSARIGRIRLGMTVDEFYTVYNHTDAELVDLQIEGFFSPALKVLSNGHPLLIAHIAPGWTIFSIELEDPRFHSVEGLRVGSTFAQIKRAYPGFNVGMGEGQWFARVDSRHASFGLDSGEIRKPPTDTSKVVSILVVR